MGEADVDVVAYFTPEAFDRADAWSKTLVEILEEEGSDALSWDDIITAVHWYAEVTVPSETSEVSGIQNGVLKFQDDDDDTIANFKNAIIDSVKKNYAEITELNMSGKQDSQYTISTGALKYFTSLEELNLSDTGITELGGLVTLTNLKTLNLSDNALPVAATGGLDLGALAVLTKLEDLNLSNTGFNNDSFGAIAALPVLEALDLSGNEGLTDIEPLGVYNTALVGLNVSETGLTSLAKGVFTKLSNLKYLEARNLDLSGTENAIADLYQLASADDFDANGKYWDLGGTCLHDPDEHVLAIQEQFEDAEDCWFGWPTVLLDEIQIFDAGDEDDPKTPITAIEDPAYKGIHHGLLANIIPSHASIEEIGWSTSDDGVVEITEQDEGYAEIEINDAGKATITLTVTDAKGNVSTATVEINSYVAMIEGEKPEENRYFPTLAEAITEAADDETVVLLTDIGESMNIEEANKVTVDLDGHTFDVEAGAVIRSGDITFVNGHIWTGDQTLTVSGNETTVTFGEDLEINSNKETAVKATESATLIVDGSNIHSNTVALSADGGATVTLNAGEISTDKPTATAVEGSGAGTTITLCEVICEITR